MSRSDIYDGSPGFCEHCWNISDVLKLWDEWETVGCVCWCHTPPEPTPVKKKGKKK